MIRLLSKAFTAIVVIIAVSGCNEWKNVDLGGFKIPDLNIPTPSPTPSDVDDDRAIIPKIVETLKAASKDDCLKYATFYIGISEYLKHSPSITKTVQLAPPSGIVVGLREDYKWEVGKNKEFTDFVEKDMDTYLELSKPRDIDDAYRTKLVKTFRIYGNAAFIASQSK